MSSKPLPKSLQREIDRRFADRVDEGWTERDGWSPNGWSHWVWLKPGWRNDWVDPVCALHAIHEGTIRDVITQLKHAAPCDCDECKRELNQ